MPGANLRFRSGALYANSEIAVPVGAGNSFRRRREFLSRGQRIHPWERGMPSLRLDSWNQPASDRLRERRRRGLRWWALKTQGDGGDAMNVETSGDNMAKVRRILMVNHVR
jgi:hypothetical protein